MTHISVTQREYRQFLYAGSSPSKQFLSEESCPLMDHSSSKDR